MILQTVKALVTRFKGRKESLEQTQPLPAANIKPIPTTTPSDDTHATTDSHPVNAQDPNAVSTPGFFSNAHNFAINNLTQFTQTFSSDGAVLQLLYQKRIPGAEVDSSARDPPPKCHPNTRKSLRARIIDWIHGRDRRWRMLWILGPMGVGKSAIAQTMAEELSGRLGAALFFSRPNNRDDPDGVIPTLAYQLAVKLPDYRRIVTERLVEDRTILEKNRRIQFKELIIEPFRFLMSKHPELVQKPLLVILDGLDECKGKEAQCELIELISEHVRQVKEFPLLWMISSRPEWHLKGLLSQPDFPVPCQREEILIDDNEARQDMALFLKNEFENIRRKYYDQMDGTWPPKTHVRRIFVRASGHFGFASTIINYVGDESQADPRGQLDRCIRFLNGIEIAGALHPFHALDLLYRQILSNGPNDTLTTTMRILGLHILYPRPKLTAYCLANFLCLDQATFYRSLQHLHSVIEIPPPGNAHTHYLHFYHASFSDYLSDSHRSGPFAIDKAVVHYDVATHSLKWQNHPQVEGAPNYLEPKWLYTEVDTYEARKHLERYSSVVGWKACCRVSKKDIPRIVIELEHFDFTSVHEPMYFGDFLVWLYKLFVRIIHYSGNGTGLTSGQGNRSNPLICFEPFADEVSAAGPILIRHSVKDIKDYCSKFNVTSHPYQDKILQFRLGRLNHHIALVVTMQRPLPPPGDLNFFTWPIDLSQTGLFEWSPPNGPHNSCPLRSSTSWSPPTGPPNSWPPPPSTYNQPPKLTIPPLRRRPSPAPFFIDSQVLNLPQNRDPGSYAPQKEFKKLISLLEE